MIDKDALLSRREDTESGFPESTVDIPGLGSVRVRGLSRHEVIHLQSAKGALAVERVTVSLGLVDPVLTEDEVARWQRVSPAGELDSVTQAIGQLSGVLEGSAKAAYKSVSDEPDAGVRVLPSAATEHDGSPDEAGPVE
jgi:hypothetical protein